MHTLCHRNKVGHQEDVVPRFLAIKNCRERLFQEKKRNILKKQKIKFAV